MCVAMQGVKVLEIESQPLTCSTSTVTSKAISPIHVKAKFLVFISFAKIQSHWGRDGSLGQGWVVLCTSWKNNMDPVDRDGISFNISERKKLPNISEF